MQGSHLMTIKTYPVPADYSKTANIDLAQYESWYQQSIEKPEQFWREQAQSLIQWTKPFDSTSNCDLKSGQAQWFAEGELNVSVNCTQ